MYNCNPFINFVGDQTESKNSLPNLWELIKNLKTLSQFCGRTNRISKTSHKSAGDHSESQNLPKNQWEIKANLKNLSQFCGR